MNAPLTKRQMHRFAVRAVRAAKKLRDASIDADAVFATYHPNQSVRSRAALLRQYAELGTRIAADLLVESGDEMVKDVTK